jgi:hypothetical protein
VGVRHRANYADVSPIPPLISEEFGIKILVGYGHNWYGSTRDQVCDLITNLGEI